MKTIDYPKHTYISYLKHEFCDTGEIYGEYVADEEVSDMRGYDNIEYIRADLVKNLIEFVKEQKPLDGDFQQFVNDNFWDLV